MKALKLVVLVALFCKIPSGYIFPADASPIIQESNQDEKNKLVNLIGKNVDIKIIGKWSRVQDYGKKENEGGYIGMVTITYEFYKDGRCEISETGISCLGETKGKKITEVSKKRFVSEKGIIYLIDDSEGPDNITISKDHYNQKSNRLSLGKFLYVKK